MRFFTYLLAAAVLVAAPWFAAARVPGSFEYRPYVGLRGADSKRKNIDYHRVMKRDELTKVWLAHVGVDQDRHSDYYNKAHERGLRGLEEWGTQLESATRPRARADVQG